MQEFFEAVLWAKIWPIAAVAFALLGIADGARRIVVGVILTIVMGAVVAALLRVVDLRKEL